MLKMTSREFNQDLGRAKRESLCEPVIVTDRGSPKHVLLSYEQYEALMDNKDAGRSLFDCFSEADPDVGDIDFDVLLSPRSKTQRPPVEFD